MPQLGGIEVRVEEADAVLRSCDVLVLKFAQLAYRDLGCRGNGVGRGGGRLRRALASGIGNPSCSGTGLWPAGDYAWAL